MRHLSQKIGPSVLCYLLSVIVLGGILFVLASSWAQLEGKQYLGLYSGAKVAEGTVDSVAPGQVCYSFKVGGRFYSKCDTPGTTLPGDLVPGSIIPITYSATQPSISCACHPGDELSRLNRNSSLLVLLAPLLAAIPTYLFHNWRRPRSRHAFGNLRLRSLLDLRLLFTITICGSVLLIYMTNTLIWRLGGSLVILLIGGAIAILTTSLRSSPQNQYLTKPPLVSGPERTLYKIRLRTGAIWESNKADLEIGKEGITIREHSWVEKERIWSIYLEDLEWIEKAGYCSIRLGLDTIYPLLRFEGRREREEFVFDLKKQEIEVDDSIVRIDFLKSI